MKKQETYRLPNNKVTTNTKEYIDAWRELAKPIEQALNVRLRAFDPDLRFVAPGNYMTFSVDVPVAALIFKLTKEVEYMRSILDNPEER